MGKRPRGKRIYWLKGMAGTGKTTISMTLAREYHLQKQLGASFFFSRGGGDLASTKRFATTMASQLAEILPDFKKRLKTAVEACPSINSLGLYDQWEKLMLQPLAAIESGDLPSPIVFVVDALDECDNEDDIGVLIQCLVATAELGSLPLRIFITSRPEQPINMSFNSISSNTHTDFVLHDIEHSIVEKDLEIYYKHELSNMDLDATLITEDTIRRLVQKSHRLFIHATTVCHFIREGKSIAAQRLTNIIEAQSLQLEPESELDLMYTTVLKNALNTKLSKDEQQIFQERFTKTVGSIVILFDRMTPTNLATMIDEPKETMMKFLNYLGSVLDVSEQEQRRIGVLHPSFRDSILSSTRCTSTMFCIDARKVHGHLFNRCLDIMSKNLRKNMCKLRRLGIRAKDISRSNIDDCIAPVVQYACSYWVYHLQQSDISLNEHPGILDFFRTRFLFWLEVLTLIGRVADGIDMMKYLNSSLQVSPSVTSPSTRTLLAKMKSKFTGKVTSQESPSLRAVVHDATRFLFHHSSTIEEAPLQLYCSALIFSPEMSIIRRFYDHHIPTWISKTPSLSEMWEPRLRMMHTSKAHFVAFSPNGKLLASGYEYNEVILWDTATGSQRLTLKGHLGMVLSISFSPDSRLLVSSSNHGPVRLWNTTTGAQLPIPQNWIKASFVSFLPNNQLVLSRKNKIHEVHFRLYNTETSTELRTYQSPSSTLQFAVSFDGKLIVYTQAADIFLIDLETGEPRHSWKLNANSVRFSPDSKLLATGTRKNIKIWDIMTGKMQRVISADGIREVLFSPDGKSIAATCKRQIRLWDVESGRIQCVFQDHGRAFTDSNQPISFSPDGSIIASARNHNEISLWDISFGTKQIARNDKPRLQSAFAAMPDGKHIASVAPRGVCQIWDARTGENTGLYTQTITAMNEARIACSPDGKLVAVHCGMTSFEVWDTQKGRLFTKYRAYNLEHVAFSPDSKLIAILSSKKKIHFCDARSGSEVYTFTSPAGAIESFAFSPDGKFIALVILSYEKECRIEEGEGLHGYIPIHIYLPGKAILHFSPDSKLLSCYYSNISHIWDAETRKLRHIKRNL
ncbi:Vegetative incompatibility HET-E-1-like protein [Cladobotryum mycophilum]|uniref:Mitochondrial division protein 1 n=1 Tax=Cladobotryum mycophilum TaxID=491253 RepID=A0ABR0SBI8_9HYPO